MPNNSNFKLLTSIFTTYFKIGLFTFGGGYAMIPLIEKEIVQKQKWIDNNEFLDIIAISQTTPGPLAVNMATFTGYKIKNKIGSFIATFGVCLPSFIIIFIVGLFLSSIKNNIYVINCFKGIRAGVVVLMLSAVIKLTKNLKKNLFNILLIINAFFLVYIIKVNTILVLILGAFSGIVYSIIIAKKHGDNI